MTRMDQALSNIAAADPKWLLERKAIIERRQRELNERVKLTATVPSRPTSATRPAPRPS